MKRSLAALFALLLAVSMLAGCATASQAPTAQLTAQPTIQPTVHPTAQPTVQPTSEASATPTTAPTKGEPDHVTLVVNGDITDRVVSFTKNELAKYLMDKLNLTASIEYLPWDDLEGGQVELRLAAGEDIAVYTDITYMSHCVALGYAADLTEAMDKEGAVLRAKMPKTNFDAFTLNKKLYAIPIGNKNNAGEWYNVCVRQDLLEECGMTQIKSIADLEAFYAKCIALHPEYAGFAAGGATDSYGPARMISCEISDKNMLWLNDYIFVDNNTKDNKIYSWFESPEFQKTAEVSKRWQDLGIMSKQYMSDPGAASAKFDAGQGMFCSGNAGYPWEEFPTLNAIVPTARLVNYRLGDTSSRPLNSRGTYSVGFVVSAQAKNPGAYVRLFNDIYTDQSTYDFWTYGVKDVDYTLDTNGKLLTKKNDGVFFNEWVTANVDYLRWDSKIPDSYIQVYKHFNDGCIPQKDIGFVFNPDPVKTVIAQMEAVRTEYLVPIAVGLKDYNTYYPDALKRLKDAGLDQYIAEFQKQFSVFYNNK